MSTRPTVQPIELSVSQAAEWLNVSQRYLMKLLETGEIGFHIESSQHRVRLDDVQNYQVRRDSDADEALDELVSQAQELNMGYGT